MDLLALDQPPVGYLRRFLIGVARLAHDTGLEAEAKGLTGAFRRGEQAELRAYISSRIQDMPLAV